MIDTIEHDYNEREQYECNEGFVKKTAGRSFIREDQCIHPIFKGGVRARHGALYLFEVVRNGAGCCQISRARA